jgi:hypothetical protein
MGPTICGIPGEWISPFTPSGAGVRWVRGPTKVARRLNPIEPVMQAHSARECSDESKGPATSNETIDEQGNQDDNR